MSFSGEEKLRVSYEYTYLTCANSCAFQMHSHRALLIPEILQAIFKFTGSPRIPWTPNEKREHRCNLLRFALCCRAFARTALDVLWESLPSMQPSIKLLPVEDVQGCLVRLLPFLGRDMELAHLRRINARSCIVQLTANPGVD